MSDRHSGTCHKENWGGYCDCRPRRRRKYKKLKRNIVRISQSQRLK